MNKILISSVLASLLFVACGDDKKTAQSATSEVKKEVKVVETKTSLDKVKEASSDISNTVAKASGEVKDTVVKAGSEVMEKSKVVVKELSDSVSKEVKEKTQNIVKDTKEVVAKTVEKTSEMVDEVKKTTTNAIASVTDSTPKASANGEALFKACIGCHGAKAEKKALGKSQVIAGWDKQKVIDALNGYKNGTYGGAMKAIMTGQVANKSSDDIAALAGYISKL